MPFTVGILCAASTVTVQQNPPVVDAGGCPIEAGIPPPAFAEGDVLSRDLPTLAAGGCLATYSYTLGAADNRLSVAELSGRTASYVYDDLYRLTKETITGDPSGKNGVVDYTPDAIGNRLSRTSTVTAVPSATLGFDSTDRLLSDTYDNNGNTRLSGGNIDVYDFENRLISRPGNGNTITLVYDGNRVSKTVNGVTTNYLVDTTNLARYAQVVEELSTQHCPGLHDAHRRVFRPILAAGCSNI